VERPKFEIADILRRFGEEYREQYGRLSGDQARVVAALVSCRTAELGGHVEACDACGRQRIAYNSCRDRHCPKCQAANTAAWVERERAYLLPVPYSHVVFTLPHGLAPLALQNARVMYGLLFQAVAQTLLEIARNPKHLGAQIGYVAILHTWGQQLLHHPHLHCLVPAGGIALDGSRWVRCRKNFFLSVRVLGKRFRGRYLALLERSYREGKLVFHGKLAHLSQPHAFAGLLRQARERKWVVYAKPPFGGSEAALKYLARYTHRIAISNARLLSGDEESVRFTWKDYRHGNRVRPMSLPGCEFMRRLLLHALPKRFVRIRRYGILANCQREKRLARCRQLLGADRPALVESAAPEAGDDLAAEVASSGTSGYRERRCACGQGWMRVVEVIPVPRCRRRCRAPPAGVGA
jgi:hypothetical protein